MDARNESVSSKRTWSRASKGRPGIETPEVDEDKPGWMEDLRGELEPMDPRSGNKGGGPDRVRP